MVCEKSRNNINFFRIVTVLRRLRDLGMISKAEYIRAKEYYEKVTGADMALCD